MRIRLQVALGAMAFAAALAACSSPTPTPTPTATPEPTPTPVPTATPTPGPGAAPSGPGLSEGLAMFAGPLSAESVSCLDVLQVEQPDLTLTTLMGPDATALDGMRVLACLTDEEGERFPSGDQDVPLSPSQSRCVLESVDTEALANLTQGQAMPPALMMAMGACVEGMLPTDGTASNPNDGTDTFTPPSPEERAAFIAGFAEVRGVDEGAAACVADGLTAIRVSLSVERFLTAVVTEGPIAVVLAECGVPAAMPLGGG